MDRTGVPNVSLFSSSKHITHCSVLHCHVFHCLRLSIFLTVVVHQSCPTIPWSHCKSAIFSISCVRFHTAVNIRPNIAYFTMFPYVLQYLVCQFVTFFCFYLCFLYWQESFVYLLRLLQGWNLKSSFSLLNLLCFSFSIYASIAYK